MPWPGQPGPIVREREASGGPLGPPLSIKQAAQFLGFSAWTVRQKLLPQGLPHFRSGPSGKLIFYTNQLAAWIEKRQGGTIL
jgi:hypothetical protein